MMSPALPATRHNNVPGILAMLAGTAAFVCNDSIVKLLGASLPPGEIMTLRGTLCTSFLFAAALWFGALNLPTGVLRKPAFALRLIGDVGATLTFIVSLMHMRFADAGGIAQFQPLAITAGSAMFLGERVGVMRWLAALVGLIGMLLIIKPGSVAFEPFALMSAMSVLFVACSDLSTRVVSQGVPALTLGLCSSVTVTLAALALGSSETWAWPTHTEWLGLATAALLVVAGLLFIITAIRMADLSVIAPFRYSGVLLAVLLQIGIWGQTPDPVTLLGIALLVGAGLYTFQREQSRAEHAPRKRR